MDTVADVAFVVGRGTIAIVIALLALRYQIGGIGMTYADSYRLPFPRLVAPLGGLVLVAAAAMVGVGAWADLGALMVVAVLLPLTLLMHPFWREVDPLARKGQQVHFAKNLGLVGGALVVFYVYYDGVEAPWSLTDPLFGRD
jgi:putative oxidoreductase